VSSSQIAKALGMPSIFALIGIPGDFPEEVKKLELKRPSLKPAEIRERYGHLAKLIDLLNANGDSLRTIGEFYSQIPKYSAPDQRGAPSLALHELFLLKEFLYHYGNLHSHLRKLGWMDQFPLPDLTELFRYLDPEGGGLPVFHLSAAFSQKLGGIMTERLLLANKLKHARAKTLDDARAELQMPQLKEEFTLSRADAGTADRILHSPFFVLSSENVANYSFVLADDDLCLDLKKQLSLLNEKQEKAESHVLKEISRHVYTWLPILNQALHYLHTTCWRFMLADFALRHGCCVPKLTRKKSIKARKAVNLPLKLHLEELGRHYQKVDYDFNMPVSLLTGPNMGGKTTILKTIGQLCWLARMAIPLPCAEAELPLFDNIWYNQSDDDSGADLSSFGREVVAFSDVLRQEGTSLFLLDEFARGTNPAEGERLASAVLRHLSETSHMCVAATHFTAPAMLDGLAQYSIAGLDMAVLDASRPASASQRLKALNAAMDYRLKRLQRHQAPPLNAITVARALGLPEAILKYTELKEP
jgi:hypothetical protein